MNRTEFQSLADVRIDEAGVLLAAGRWAGAYYLAGYAVECALKACILARVERTGVLFEDKKFSEKCWTHNFEVLLEAAELEATRNTEAAANQKFDTHWRFAWRWKEDARYRFISQIDAESLFAAVTDPNDGVLRWIRQHW